MKKYRYTYFDGTHRFHQITEKSVIEVHVEGLEVDFETGEGVRAAHILASDRIYENLLLKRGKITAKEFKKGFNTALKHIKSNI